ncbi:hypothetical protein QTJ16_000524 [Diplocarpon rosae]|uniref:Glutamine synthetase n=1 Tax=Diplocarpon rosae TaxID=946125 RepID=A0AAD9WHP0_9HELO|nr:hypothetical protein QTJ16_000524 [Diplocarpon rosae]PBP22991.1 extracellular developmental signal biosynthesis protein FluG [Diplocarpon rosae]
MGEVNESHAVESSVIRSFLNENPEVEFVRFQWVDYSGVMAARVATRSFVLSLDQKKQKISTPSPILTAVSLDGSLLVDEIHFGIDQAHPDWSSVRILPHHPNTAAVMCFIEEGEQPTGTEFRRCPRSRLCAIVSSAKLKHDIEMLVGMEIEFFICEEVHGVLQPVATTKNVYSSASLRNKCLPVLEEIVQALQQASIKVRQFHSEGDAGLFEISTEPLPPLQSADALYFSHETIRAICLSHGLRATMHPKPFEKSSIVGSHYHLSISRTEHEESFLAGLLGSWRALAAFYQPNYDSNARTRKGERVTWGPENKTASIRKIRAGHWELRGPDATANAYLALMAIITAGVLGMDSGKALEMTGATQIMFKAPLEDDVAAEMGIVDRMPFSLKEALESLQKDTLLTDAIGPELITRYVIVKTKEEEAMGQLILTERKEIAMAMF